MIKGFESFNLFFRGLGFVLNSFGGVIFIMIMFFMFNFFDEFVSYMKEQFDIV